MHEYIIVQSGQILHTIFADDAEQAKRMKEYLAKERCYFDLVLYLKVGGK
jgi:hypothetical protein